MSNPRVSRMGVLVAGIAAGSLLWTASPRGQQQVQGRGRAGTPTQAPPTVTVPQIKTPAIAVKDATQSAQTASAASHNYSGPWMNPARAEAFLQAGRQGLNYLPGEVLVKFKDGVGAEGRASALHALGSEQRPAALEWAGTVAVVRDATEPNAWVLAARMKARPEVEYAEPNFIAWVDPGERYDVPNPAPNPVAPASRPNRGSVSGGIAGAPTDADYAAFQWNFQLIGMPDAWTIQPGGRADLIVAVIDTGITGSSGTLTYPIWTGSTFQTVSMPYAPNPDLPVSRQTKAQDFVGSNVPGAPHVDLDGHASHVSGTIGEATNNALLVSGMAYNVQIMPIKVCVEYWDLMIARGLSGTAGFASSTDPALGCAYSDMAAAIHYAVDNGARVMNISLGGTSSSTTIQNALIYGASKGAFISLSMGNNFESGNPTMYPAFYASSIDGVMSVAAVGSNSAKSYYSSAGSYCEIAAPGGDSRSGTGRTDRGTIWQSTLIGSDLSGVIPRFDRYDKQSFQGTSMAAPHVAGLAALLMSQNPKLTGAQVEKIIRMTAKDLGAVGKDDSFGYGLIQPRAALFGYGISR
jgi:serine protease